MYQINLTKIYLGCNPMHTYLGIKPSEHNGTYYWVNIYRIALFIHSYVESC